MESDFESFIFAALRKEGLTPVDLADDNHLDNEKELKRLLRKLSKNLKEYETVIDRTRVSPEDFFLYKIGGFDLCDKVKRITMFWHLEKKGGGR